MGKKLGPNDPCPCGSGKKLKKCCGAKGAVVGFSRTDRTYAYQKLDSFADRFSSQDDQAFSEFWGRWWDDSEQLPSELDMMSEGAANAWFYFDRPLDDGRLLVDVALEDLDLTPGERNFLLMARGTAMHLYEVEKTVPGVSITLRDVLEGDRVTVTERLASRQLARHDWLAARILPRGASGGPELDTVLPIPGFCHEALRDHLAEMRDEYRSSHAGTGMRSFYKALPPLFHDIWVGSILEPNLPDLRNTDGDPVLWTRVIFDVEDGEAVARVLDGVSDLERAEGTRWDWSGTNAKADVVSLGLVELDGQRLVLQANSAERAQRGREMIEQALGEAVRHRATTHEDPVREAGEAVRDHALGRTTDLGAAAGEEDIPPEVVEALTLNHLGRHYRSWIDEPVPALEDETPRAAAKNPALQDKLVDLIHSLEGMYQKALMRGEPAYDPSWMWAELGMDDDSTESCPPPLAHERVDEMVPGAAELSRSVAEAERQRPSFSDKATVLDQGYVDSHLSVRRFLRDLKAPAHEDEPATWKPENLPAYLACMINYDLHRRKAFWVDEGLTWQLSNTDLDALGRELRVPFASFALVFTDRRTLSLGERLLSKDRTSPLSGHFLEVTTVYVTERSEGDERTLSFCFAFDAMGADLPQLVTHELMLGDETQIGELVQQAGPAPVVADPPVEDASPLRGLLHVVVNAILYATSAGVEPSVRKPSGSPPKRRSPRRTERPKSSSEEVYYLPGAIEISQLRRFQSLDRIPDGRSVLRRFMVRGHWRRASKNWKDQRMRWIEPYWKGPDLAAVIERTYRLKE